MMSWLLILGLSLSSSIDNFGVGVSYGVRGIRIGHFANLIIAIIAFVFSEIGIIFGEYLTRVLPGSLSTIIGAVFLLIIGLRILVLTMPKKKRVIAAEPEQHPDTRKTITGYFGTLDQADLDQSGDINFFEAIVLGIGVSMNALTNGLGAGLIGLSPLAISLLAAIFSFLAIWAGVTSGRKIANLHIGSWSLGEFSTVISGIVLLIIAVHSLL